MRNYLILNCSFSNKRKKKIITKKKKKQLQKMKQNTCLKLCIGVVPFISGEFIPYALFS